MYPSSRKMHRFAPCHCQTPGKSTIPRSRCSPNTHTSHITPVSAPDTPQRKNRRRVATQICNRTPPHIRQIRTPAVRAGFTHVHPVTTDCRGDRTRQPARRPGLNSLLTGRFQSRQPSTASLQGHSYPAGRGHRGTAVIRCGMPVVRAHGPSLNRTQ